MKCPHCERTLESICASHDYMINLVPNTDLYSKTVGDVDYVCGECLGTLAISDIEDILRQVDEL